MLKPAMRRKHKETKYSGGHHTRVQNAPLCEVGILECQGREVNVILVDVVESWHFNTYMRCQDGVRSGSRSGSVDVDAS
jgi:hypothetical protein